MSLPGSAPRKPRSSRPYWASGVESGRPVGGKPRWLDDEGSFRSVADIVDGESLARVARSETRRQSGQEDRLIGRSDQSRLISTGAAKDVPPRAMDLGEVRHSRGSRKLVKVGLVSYGVVHLLVAWIALTGLRPAR